MFAVFQMTYVGAPMIYYGDEVGMWGANDPDCRKPMVWEDMVYDDEVTLPDGSKKATPDKVEVNTELLAHYQKLIGLRHALPALRTGSFETVLTDDGRQLYGFRRKLGDEEVVVVLNNSAAEQMAEIELKGAWRDRWNEADVVVEDGKAKLRLAPRGAVILVRE